MPSPAKGHQKMAKTNQAGESWRALGWRVRILKAQVNSVRAEYCNPPWVTRADLAYVIDGHSFGLIQVEYICSSLGYWNSDSSFSLSLVCVQCSPSTPAEADDSSCAKVVKQYPLVATSVTALTVWPVSHWFPLMNTNCTLAINIVYDNIK